MSTNPSKNKNVLVIILSIALVVSVLGNIFQFFNTRQLIVLQQTTKVDLDTMTARKERLDKEFDLAVEELNKYKGQNAEMDSLLTVANEKIEQQRRQIARLIDQNEDYQILRMRMDEMRKEKDMYLAQIKELQEQVNKLTNDNYEKQVIIDQNRDKINDLSQKVEKGAKLKVASIVPKAINITAGGREKETDKASKAERLSISFVIAENSLASHGQHTVYLVVKNTEGYILSDGTGVKKFKLENGNEMPYSRSTQVQWDGESQTKVLTFDQDFFNQGSHAIEIYIDGYLAGSSKITLY